MVLALFHPPLHQRQFLKPAVAAARDRCPNPDMPNPVVFVPDNFYSPA
jgi:hypothetical protein